MKTKTSTLQNPLTARSWRSCLQLLVALALLGWSAMAQAAQTDTWTGLGADNNWNTSLNWDMAVTTAGDNLIFAPSTRPAPTNDFTGLQINSITFNTNGYVLVGNALTITNGITDSAGSNTCSIPLTLGASQTFQNNAGGGTNSQTSIGTSATTGTINLGTNNLTIAGNGNVYLNGLISSTNGGSLTVNNSGVARLGPSTGSPGNGFGTNAVVMSITSTNTTYLTNITVITNLIVDGTPTGFRTNTVVTTNNVYTYGSTNVYTVLDVVTVGGGTLQLFGSSGAAIIPNGPSIGNVLVNGTLDLNAISPTINGLEGSGTVDNWPSSVQGVTGANTGTPTLTVGNGGSNAVFSGVIQNTAGSVALTKTGWGTQTLDGANSYSGQTIVNQGKLVVGASGSLGTYSTVVTIQSGAILDVTALGSFGYLPQRQLNVAAGTPTKPYTNFWGSYNAVYPTFIVTTTTNYYTLTNVVTGVSTNYTTNDLSYTYSSNSIISVITNDIIGNFSVLGGGSISPVTAVAPGIATWTINGNLTLDCSLGLGAPNNVNRVNFLLNDTTTPGGGTNDLIDVSGTLSIGDELDVVVSPITGTLAAGKYTLFRSASYVPVSPNDSAPANLVLIAPRGITGTFDTTTQPGNILLSASGTANPASLVWSATSTANNSWDTHVTQNWKNGGSPDYFYSQDGVTFDDTGFGTVFMPIPVTPGTNGVTFNNSSTNYTFTASSTAFFNGTGGLTMNGPGTVTLNNPNKFTGPVTMNGGTLILGSYGGFGNVIVYNGVPPGQLVFSGNATLANGQNIADTSQSTSFGGLTLNSGANARLATIEPRGANDGGFMSFGANVNRAVGSSLYVSFTTRAGNANSGVYFTNSLPWSNGLLFGGWAHTGTDWLQPLTNLNNGNNGTGSLNYSGYTNNGALATWQATNNMHVNNASFALTASAAINTLKLTGPATVTISAGQTLTNRTGGLLVSSAGAGPSTITGGTLMGAAGADLIVLQNLTGGNVLTIGSVIADNGSATALTLGGLGGTLILTNNNTYTGPTYINAGSLQVGAGDALGSIATSSSIIDSGGLLTFNRPDATSVGSVSGTGGITQLGTGTLTLTADNSLRGVVTISAGTLQVGNGGASGSISNITSVVNSGTLVFNNSGTLGYRGVISGIGRVVQNGSGTLMLQTNETYSGNTIVSNGTMVLAASGSISNTAAIVVNAGAVFDASAAGGLNLRSAAPSEILAGGGTIKGTVTVAAGTKITPGTNGVIGALTFNNDLTLNGGNLVLDVTNSPGTGDQILVAGVLNQNSGNVLINVKGTPLANGLYPLIYATNGLNGTSANNLIAIGFLQSGQLAMLTNSTPNKLDLLVYSGVAPSVTWQGDGSQNVWNTTTPGMWQGGAFYQQGDYVTFNDSGSANPAVNLSIVEYPASVTVNATNNNYTFGVNGGSGVNRISGGATLTKNGSGTLTLQTVNDYSGGTVINGGVVQLNGDGGGNDDGMIGSGAVVNNGTLIANNVNTETLAGNISGSGLLVQQGVGRLILTGDNTAYTGPITFSNFLQVGDGISGTLGTGNVTNNGSLLFNAAGAVVNANISGSGNVTNLGGTVTLSGTNTYAGNTVIPAGTLRVGSANAIPHTAIHMNDNTTPNPVGTLDLKGNDVTVAILQTTNTGIGTSTFQPCRIVNNGSGTNTLTIDGGTTTTFYGQLVDNTDSGNGRLALVVKSGSTLNLFCGYDAAGGGPFNSTFSGGLTISNASVFLGNAGQGTDRLNGQRSAGLGTITLLGGTGTGFDPRVGLPTNAVIYAPMATGSANSSRSEYITVPTINVPAGQSGSIFLPKYGGISFPLTGSGTLTIQPAYVRGQCSGNWTAFTGTMLLQAVTTTNGDLGGGFTITGAGNLGLPNATLEMRTTNLTLVNISGGSAGNVFSIGALTGGDNTSAIGGGTMGNGGSGGAATTIWAIGGLGLSTTNGSQITDAGCGIRKVGAGSLTLTNNIMSFGGQLVVSNGTLAFAPLGNNPGPFNALTNNFLVGSNYTIVSPGILDVSAAGGTLYLYSSVRAQTLYGNGMLNGNLVVSNSLVAPSRRASDAGNYPGKLTVSGTAAVNFGSTLTMAINRTNAVTGTVTNDSLTAGGGLTINSARLTVVNVGDTNYPGGSSNVFRFFDGPVPFGPSSGITNITLPALPANLIWVTNLTLDGSMALVNTTPGINPNPPVMAFSFDGTQLALGWATNLGWILQSQTNSASVGLSANWVDVAGSAAQTNWLVTNNPANPTVFFRLRLP
jgi:fibronectin-binding autotransporter adhesin